MAGATNLYADTPQGFNYQAVARDASGNILQNIDVDVTINLLQGHIDGPVAFSEYHRAATSDQGLITLVIGSKEPAHFADINWAEGPYFIEVVINGQTMGTSQLMSVPYALYAAESGTSSNDEMIHGIPEATEPGEMMYFDGTEWIIIPEGEQGQPLIFCNGYPHWGSCDDLPHITHIEPVNQVIVNQGTPEEEALSMLQTYTTITDSDGKAHSVNLNWSLDEYNAYKPGSYQASSAFSLPYGVAQSDPPIPLELNANITVASGDDEATVTDYDGNVYQTVEIGDQKWMAENLRVTHYEDGTPVEEGMYYYDDNPANAPAYGKLYTWHAATNLQHETSSAGAKAQDICPSGYRLPNNNDWQQLIAFMNEKEMDGGTIKSTRTYPDAHPRWLEPNTGATNVTGFTAYPAGMRRMDGIYRQMEVNAFFWSATESTGLPDSEKVKKEDNHNNRFLPQISGKKTEMAYFWTLNYSTNEFHFMNLKKHTGLSVRCIKM